MLPNSSLIAESSVVEGAWGNTTPVISFSDEDPGHPVCNWLKQFGKRPRFDQ
jgi:hypothetical protein